jgi:uncharacterized OB-fold protein
MPGDIDTLRHWEGLRARTLLVQRCDDCGTYRWQPRELCWRCRSWDYTWTAMSGRARLYSWTEAHRSPPPFDAQVPYLIGMVALEEQDDLMMVGRIVGDQPDSLRPGQAMVVDYTDTADGVTLACWRPAR